MRTHRSIAIAGLSHFITCTTTAGGHHALACLTHAYEIEEWFGRLTLEVVALSHVFRQNLDFSAWEVTPMVIIPILKAACQLTAPGMHVQWGCKVLFSKILSDRALICEE